MGGAAHRNRNADLPMVSRALSRRLFLAGGLASLSAAPAVALPLRLAVTEFDLAEALLTLGVTPVAMTEAGRYRALFTAPALPPECVELGASWEPNLEQLARIAPEATLVSAGRDLLVPFLAAIAPVVRLEPPDEGGRARRAFALLRMIGLRLGRTDLAGAAEARFAARLDMARRRLPPHGRPVLVVALVEGGTHLEIYGAGSLFDDGLGLLGLANAAPLRMPGHGWVIRGIEALAAEPEADVLVLDFGATTERTLGVLARSRLWRSLPQVAAGRVHRIGAVSVWGGVPTLVTFAERIAEVLGRRGDHGG